MGTARVSYVAQAQMSLDQMLPPSLMADGVCLKPHVDSYRHIYQGRVWYVFHDRAVHRHYRVSGEGAELISVLDGRRSLAEALAALRARDGEDAIDALDAAQFMRQLQGLGLLQTGEAPNVAQLDARADAMRRRRLVSALRTPLAFRIKLLDPTALLTVIMPWLGWIFSPFGALLFMGVVGTGAAIGLMNWDLLTADATDRLLSTENLVLAGLVYPLVKLLHELGHAVVLSRLGAEVRQIGLLFAAFIPVPYVDASASAVLERRSDRIMVGAAGILVEMFLGSLALIVWLLAEPGVVRAICYNIIVISGFSTLLFNGNPLQRYDGYYILSDLVGIPGLGTRSGQYMQAWFRRIVMGDSTTPLPLVSRTESWWFLLYGPTSFVYRFSLMLVISFYVAERYPGLGLILAVWSVGGYLSGPIDSLFGWARKEKWKNGRRGAIGLGALVMALLIMLFVIPAPSAVVAPGVVAMPDAAAVRPHVAGQLVRLLAAPGSRILAGEPVALLAEPGVLARVDRLEARVAELKARRAEALAIDVGRAGPLSEMLAQAGQELTQARRDAAALVVRSPGEGVLLVSHPDDLPGRYLSKGESFATIWDPAQALIRAVVPMSEIAALRATLADGPGGRGVSVRPGWDVLDLRDAQVVRLVPAASDTLPSAVMTLEGGGPFAVTRSGDGQSRISEPAYEIDVRTVDPLPVAYLNGRMHVRFILTSEPLGQQLLRHTRLLFLRRLHV